MCDFQKNLIPAGFAKARLKHVARAFLLCAAMIVALLFITAPAWSQEVTGAINGTITDPSGSPIVGATVTATDTAGIAHFPPSVRRVGDPTPPL
jgi:hypothetical protein